MIELIIIFEQSKPTMKVVCTIVLLMMLSTLGEWINPGFVAGIKVIIN